MIDIIIMFLAFFREGERGVCDRGTHSPLKAPEYHMAGMIKLGICRVRSKMPRSIDAKSRRCHLCR